MTGPSNQPDLTGRCRIAGAVGLAAACLLLGGTPTGGQQHDHHAHTAAPAAAAPADPHAAHRPAAVRPGHRMGSELRVVRVVEVPEGFRGNVAFDRESGRLFLLSFGPPANTRGPSTLYEVAVEDGRVLRSAQMPFVGELGTPTVAGGELFQLVAHESKVYRVHLDAARFGEIAGVVPLPRLSQIERPVDEPLRFPFISFKGLSVLPGNRLLAHAQDLAEFFVLDATSGEVVRRVPTLRAVEGIAVTDGTGDRPGLVLASSDPVGASFQHHVRRFSWRASHGTVPSVRYGKEALHWVLLDPSSGEVVASLRWLDPRTDPAGIALVDHQQVEGAPFGRFVFVTTGKEGVFTLEWTPGMRS